MASEMDLADVLDDLCVRFLNNLPDSEYETFERLFFAVEAAHWFYDDFHREENPKLPKLPLSAFAKRIFAHSPMLQPYADDVEYLTVGFKKYKQEVPTYGAAMLNPDMTKVLLVCGWGKNGKWGFPKGKIAKDESELDAAVREVFEETGFDFSTVLRPGGEPPVYADSYVGGRLSRVFIVPGVPETTNFETRTRKEISDIRWIPITDLPDPRNKAGDGSAAPHAQRTGQMSAKNFWLVRQYVPKIKSVVKKRKQQGQGHSKETRHQVAGSSGGTGAGSSVTGKKCGKQKQSSSGGKQGKGERGVGHGAVRDEETFGGTSLGASAQGASGMSAKERDDFFRQYLEKADRRKEEMGVGDDFWPVPYVTAKDLGFAQPRDHDVLGTVALSSVKSEGNAGEPELAKAGKVGQISGAAAVGVSPGTLGTFCFDRSQVLSCLL